MSVLGTYMDSLVINPEETKDNKIEHVSLVLPCGL